MQKEYQDLNKIWTNKKKKKEKKEEGIFGMGKGRDWLIF